MEQNPWNLSPQQVDQLLKLAGVDMSCPEPVAMAMKTFSDLVAELEKML